ncbi:MAG TPA: glycosyltransferase family 4 protein [Candidatus Acidoferrales bacterium]|jgi:glycosyltransferase involved in cell wall biosynthesis|nr:glycosyltransferase family 4 protein [Candidatus Acidoferrales bacterium]
MKIILVHNSYQEAGGEEVVFESEKRLLERKGHEVIPYVRSNHELRNASLVDRIAAAPRTVWSSKSRHEFAAILDSKRPDIVHIHNTFMVISPSIYSACSERGIPVIQTLHNFRLLCPASTNFFRDGRICEACLDHTLLRSIQHGCYRNSRGATAVVAAMLAFHRALDTWRKSVTRFIALTDFAREKFITSGFSDDQFVVKPNFADPDPGERFGFGEYAVFVGRLHESKGVRVLLDAWKNLPVLYPLQIVGEGPERQELEAYAREAQLLGVVFRGRLSRAETINAVKGARFLVVPSVWYEGFPMCIVESFACGTPVVCSRLGGPSEIVEDHVTGLHFNAGDAQDLARTVQWAWNHPAQLVKMGHAARGKYEAAYTPDQNYGLLMGIYEKALAASASRVH